MLAYGLFLSVTYEQTQLARNKEAQTTLLLRLLL